MLASRVGRLLSKKQLKDLIFAPQPETLISFARLVFACFALLAVYLDPTRPALFVEETYFLLVSYVIYSLIILYFSKSLALVTLAAPLVHLIDILVLSAEIYLTDGLNSPFFTFYSFTLFTATIRWGWRGALWTALILALLLLVVSWSDLEINFQRDSEINLLIMRGAALFIVAGMLGYIGAYLARSRGRLRRLAAWPVDADDSRPQLPLSLRSLKHAVQVCGTPMVVVYWRSANTERGMLAYSTQSGGDIQGADDTNALDTLINSVECSVFHPTQTSGTSRSFRLVRELLSELRCETVDAELTDSGSYCIAPFRTLHFQGGVIVLSPKYQSEDIVSLTEIVATRISHELEQNALTREVAKAAIAHERARLTRDMHDSVLQDLAAASLMLKTATRQMQGELTEPLEEIRWLLTSQQRRIRQFIEVTQSPPAPATQVISTQLGSLVGTLERQWGCSISCKIEPADLRLQTTTSAEIFQLLSEATANAVRHGHAKHIDVTLHEADKELRIDIKDNGRGMPGNVAAKQPRSIAKRVGDLSGTLNFDSSKEGVRISIALPAT